MTRIHEQMYLEFNQQNKNSTNLEHYVTITMTKHDSKKPWIK